MKSKATGCGSISTVFSSIVLLFVSSITVIIIIIIIIIIKIKKNLITKMFFMKKIDQCGTKLYIF